MLIKKGMLRVLLLALVLGVVGCSSNQDVKDVWKGTRGWWYRNVSVPASIDYDETGSMSEYKELLAKSIIGIDSRLTDLEKIMNNADKPPTNEWVQALFARFPWISGFTGVKADGTILGQVPAMPIKPLDFYPLLEEDKKQNLRALRSNVQDTPMGPEVFLATPLYDAHTFLGIVSVYFDMRELLQFSETPDELVIISPQAVLWSGKYNFASTPMAGIAWDSTVLKESSGTVTNANGTFYWTMRYLGNVPIIFGVAVNGSFEESYNSRTGPTDSTGFVEPSPIVVDEDVDEQDTDTTEESSDVSSEESSNELSRPSPIYPDADDTSSTETTTDESDIDSSDVDTASESPAQVRTPSPIHPDQPGDAADDASGDSSSDTSDVDASDSTSVDASSDEDADSDQGGGYRPPSPFGPQ